MKRYGVMGAVLTATLAGVYGIYTLYVRSHEAAGPMSDFSNWRPDAAAIRSQLGDPQSPARGLPESERQKLFFTLFQSRFRDHDPQLAVGLRLETPTCLKLLCPARMEPWAMDEIALSAWREARAAFGRHYDINIYETFIGTPPIKIGELRPLRSDPEKAFIAYRYPPIVTIPLARRTRRRDGPTRLYAMPMGVNRRFAAPR